MHTVVVLYAAPIPVGHRVTVRWFDKPGFFGKKKKDSQPVVVDHDTGIEYVSDFTHDASGGIKQPDQPVAMSDGPASGFTVSRELSGKVTRCRVVTVRGFGEIDLQTHLKIAE